MPKKPAKKSAANSAKQFAVNRDDQRVMTPGKNELVVPSAALAEAISAEWQQYQAFNAAKMPLTLIAFTAIDRIADKKEAIVEVLLAYVDTDTLSYRSESGELLKRQKKEWDPVLAWAGERFGTTWKTTSGLMPLTQPKTLHKAITAYLSALDDMQLAVCCLLASGFSSLVLAIAVLDSHLKVKDAFRLSRLEEVTQAEQWGRDAEAEKRAGRLLKDMEEAGRFLRLLKKG